MYAVNQLIHHAHCASVFSHERQRLLSDLFSFFSLSLHFCKELYKLERLTLNCLCELIAIYVIFCWKFYSSQILDSFLLNYLSNTHTHTHKKNLNVIFLWFCHLLHCRFIARSFFFFFGWLVRSPLLSNFFFLFILFSLIFFPLSSLQCCTICWLLSFLFSVARVHVFHCMCVSADVCVSIFRSLPLAFNRATVSVNSNAVKTNRVHKSAI